MLDPKNKAHGRAPRESKNRRLQIMGFLTGKIVIITSPGALF